MSDAELRRRRADAFLRTGEVYHRVRPGYPDAVVDWMLPAGAADVLDLGAGTGLLTDSLIARGLSVSAVDPSESMLAVLRGRHPGVRARLGTAEDTGLPDACVDAVVIGQAWHWMDPVAASAEAARVLRPGGTLAMAWNQRVLVDAWETEFHAVQYPEAAGAQDRVGVELVAEDGESAHARPPFGAIEVSHTVWSRTVLPEDHLTLYTTHSPFLVVDAEEQAARLARWRELLGRLDADSVTQTFRTEAWRFRRDGEPAAG